MIRKLATIAISIFGLGVAALALVYAYALWRLGL